MNNRVPVILTLLVIFILAGVTVITLIPLLTSSTSEKEVAMIDNVNNTTPHRDTKVSTVIKATNSNEVDMPGVGINMDSEGWYTDLNGMQGSTAGAFEVAGFKVYPQPPWNATNNTFFFNAYKAKLELYDYLVSLGADQSVLQGSRSFTENNSFTRFGNGIDSIGRHGTTGRTSAGVMYCEVEGQKCIYIGPMAAAVNRTYYSSGDWTKKSFSAGYNWQTWKGCLVLVKKGEDYYNSNNYLYLPCVAGSAKAHTYPWGVTQTTVCIDNNHKVSWPTSWNVSDHWAGGITLNDAGSEEDIKRVATTFRFGNTNMLSYLYCTAEVCGISSDALKLFTDNYMAVGFVSYN